METMEETKIFGFRFCLFVGKPNFFGFRFLWFGFHCGFHSFSVKVKGRHRRLYAHNISVFRKYVLRALR